MIFNFIILKYNLKVNYRNHFIFFTLTYNKFGTAIPLMLHFKIDFAVLLFLIKLYDVSYWIIGTIIILKLTNLNVNC